MSKYLCVPKLNKLKQLNCRSYRTLEERTDYHTIFSGEMELFQVFLAIVAENGGEEPYRGDSMYVSSGHRKHSSINMLTSYQEWVWEKKDTHQLVHGDLQNGSTSYWNYLEDYWPCAGGFSTLNAIGTKVRDLINSGLTRWCTEV